MLARRLEVLCYRSFMEYELELAPGTTILVGRNAAGKTNLVEALQLLTAAQSFRKPKVAELIREGCGQGRIALSLAGDGRLLEVSCSLSEGKRSFELNGKRVQAGSVRGTLPSVLFCPDHLDMVKRSASVRRAALDDFGMQLNAHYAKLAQSYARILEQRNSLLKDELCPEELLRAWDESLVGTGAALTMHRIALMERLRARFTEVYRAIAPREEADVAYVPSIGELPGSRPEAEERFARALAERRDEERRRGVTLVGPHRDDLFFSIDGRSARDFASQGQQRSLVLAWKIAEVQVTRDILGQNPLLLLDDVMSELDGQRREAFMGFVEGDIQTVVTTTNLGYFSGTMLEAAQVVEVGRDGR